MKYDGTLILVSHDRDFLDGLVDKVYEFRDGKVKEHLGGISEFIEKRKIESLQDLEKKESAAPVKAKEVSQKGNASAAEIQCEPKKSGELSYQEQKEIRRRQKQMENCEKKIAELEGKMADIESVLSNPGADTDIDSLTREYLELKRELDAKMEEWVAMS